MKKFANLILAFIKTNYLVIIQVFILAIAIFAYVDVTLNSKELYQTSVFRILNIGDVQITYPNRILFDLNDNEQIGQKIVLQFSGFQNSPQSTEIKVSFPDNLVLVRDYEGFLLAQSAINIKSPQDRLAYVFYISPRDKNAFTTARSVAFELSVSVNGINQVSEINIDVESQAEFFLRKLGYISPYLVVIFISTLLFTFLGLKGHQYSKTLDDIENKLEIAEDKANQTPEKVKPIWDVSRFTLEKYINQNYWHIDLIFKLCVLVMIISFIIIVVGVYTAFNYPNYFSGALLTTGVGVITEFIGATFLIIFKSILQQANDYSKTLSEIIKIGIAVQILESLDDTNHNGNLKSKTKAELVKLLIDSMSDNESRKDS